MTFQNQNPKIFIIGGKARSGKDTVGNTIENYYHNQKLIRMQYAYYIKEYAKKISNLDGSEETKPRQFLCDLGTDLIRKQMDYLFFVKRTIEDIMVYQYFYDVILITDVRFKEELDIPKKQFDNVITIGITRPNYDNGLTDNQKNQIIETDLNDYENYDYTIVNDGTLEDLEKQVKLIIEEVEKNEKINK